MISPWVVSLLARVILSGTVPDSLGCTPSALAHDRQDWTAQAVREPWAMQVLYGLLPGEPFAFNFTASAPGTLAVRVWGRNGAGDGCPEVVVAMASDVLDVRAPDDDSEEREWGIPGELFDLRGARSTPPLPSGVYLERRGRWSRRLVVIEGRVRVWGPWRVQMAGRAPRKAQPLPPMPAPGR